MMSVEVVMASFRAVGTRAGVDVKDQFATDHRGTSE